jgi:hypothetical protein
MLHTAKSESQLNAHRLTRLRPTTLCLIGLLSITLLFLCYLALIVYHSYPFCMDEYNYVYQAKIFASGHQYLIAHGHLSPLIDKSMVWFKGKLFTKYAPGWPAILSLGTLIGLPGAVNPLLSVLTLLLLFKLSASYVGRKYALLAVLLMATNSAFLGYGASFFAHSATLFFCTAALYSHRLYQLRPTAKMAAINGALLGLAALVRPLDGLCFFLVLSCSLLILIKGSRRYLDFGIFCASATIFVVGLYAYNYSLVGVWTIATYPVWDMEFRLRFNGTELSEKASEMLKFYAHSLNTYSWRNLTEFFLPMFGYCMSALTLCAFVSHKRKRLIIYGALPLVFVLLYAFHDEFGWPLYGVRYWYPALAGLVVLLGEGLAVIARRCPNWLFALLVAVLVMLNLSRLSTDLQFYAMRLQTVDLILSDIAKECPEKSIVVLNAPPSWNDEAPLFLIWEDFLRNPYFSGPRLFVRSEQQARLVQSSFPDYKIRTYWFRSLQKSNGEHGHSWPSAWQS